jgi:hypothetical protein
VPPGDDVAAVERRQGQHLASDPGEAEAASPVLVAARGDGRRGGQKERGEQSEREPHDDLL